jgi:type II secretion system protein N
MKRAVPILGYVSWFLSCFVLFAVLTFPLDGLRPLIVAEAEKALGKGQQGTHGVDPVVQIGALSSRIVGVSAERVHVQLASREPEPGPAFDFDRLTVKLGLFSLLTGKPSVSVSADLYGGSVDATVQLTDKNAVQAIDVDIDKVDVGKVPAAMAMVGVAVAGRIEGRATVDMGKLPDKDAAGKIDLAIKGIAIGPGKLSLVPGGFELEEPIRLGDLVAQVSIKEGNGTIDSLRLANSPDVEAEVKGTLGVRPKLEQTRLDIDGYFRPTADFLTRNKKIQSALEIGEKLTLPGAPSLGKSKDDEGRYHFSARGAVKALQPQLARDNGRKGKARFQQVSTPPPGPAGAADG